MTPRQVEYMVGAAIYGAWASTILHSTAAALRDWRRKRQLRGQRAIGLEVPKAPAIVFEPKRLRMRNRPMTFSYADLKGDKLFSAPAQSAPAKVNKYVAPAAARDPELTERLQIVARRLGRARPGGITSADVIAAMEASDPDMHDRLQQRDKRLMGAVFSDGEWMQTSEWRPTGSHGRPQRVWILKAAQVAA